VVSSGYSEISAESSAHLILVQKGVLQALEERGFSEPNAKRVVTEILNNEKTEPNTRLSAAREVFKVQGSYAPEKSVNVNINTQFSEEERANLLKLLNKK